MIDGAVEMISTVNEKAIAGEVLNGEAVAGASIIGMLLGFFTILLIDAIFKRCVGNNLSGIRQ